MQDFDTRFKQRREEFDREFEQAKRAGEIVAAIMLPISLIGALLVLSLLAVALYALCRSVGLI